MSQQPVISSKLTLLGDTSVGKSCLVVRFCRGSFFDYLEPTVGAAFLTQVVQLEDESVVRFELWDTAGQERYRSLAPMYYRGASAAIVVFDITSRQSYEGAKSWVKELLRRGDPNVVIGLAGNKADMPASSREVTVEEAQEYAREHGLIYMDTSAKTGQNVRELFVAIANRLPRQAKPRDADVLPDLRAGFENQGRTNGQPSKQGCC